MSVLKEFRDFAVKGNVVDLAVAVIVGGAFGKIVTSLVEDIVMPPLGLLMGRVDFANLYLVLPGQADKIAKAKDTTLAAYKAAGVATINYGQFLSVALQFGIIAFAVFLAVKASRLAKPPAEPAPTAPTTKECPYCRSEVPILATKCKFCTSTLDASLNP